MLYSQFILSITGRRLVGGVSPPSPLLNLNNLILVLKSDFNLDLENLVLPNTAELNIFRNMTISPRVSAANLFKESF